MMKTTPLRTLVIDDDLTHAKRVATALAAAAPELAVELALELCNNAYFAAAELTSHTAGESRWDLIFSDVMMPLPQVRGKKGKACTEAERKDGDGEFPVWETIVQGGEDQSIDHGGFHLVRSLCKLRREHPERSWPHVALFSSYMFSYRGRLGEFLPAEASWLDYYDKDQWTASGEGDLTPYSDYALARAVRRVLSPLPPERGAPLRGNETVLNSETMLEWKSKASAAVQRGARILWLHGEPGTGKTALGGWLHEELHSAGARGIRVPVPCEKFTDNLPTALFGDRTKPGFVQLSKDGLLYLDNIETLPESQLRVLRALLDAREFLDFGGHQVELMARLVVCTTAAVPSTMGTEVARLYDAVGGELLGLPPLNARADDLAQLVEHFLRKEAAGKKIAPGEMPKIVESLAARDWSQGNLRQLREAVRTAAGQAAFGVLQAKHFAGVTTSPRPPTSQTERPKVPSPIIAALPVSSEEAKLGQAAVPAFGPQGRYLRLGLRDDPLQPISIKFRFGAGYNEASTGAEKLEGKGGWGVAFALSLFLMDYVIEGDRPDGANFRRQFLENKPHPLKTFANIWKGNNEGSFFWDCFSAIRATTSPQAAALSNHAGTSAEQVAKRLFKRTAPFRHLALEVDRNELPTGSVEIWFTPAESSQPMRLLGTDAALPELRARFMERWREFQKRHTGQPDKSRRTRSRNRRK